MAGIHRRNSHTFIGTTPHTHSHVFQKYFIHYSESQTLHIFPLALPFPATQHHEEFPKYTLYSLVSVSLLTLFPQPGMSFLLLTILPIWILLSFKFQFASPMEPSHMSLQSCPKPEEIDAPFPNTSFMFTYLVLLRGHVYLYYR